MNFCFWIIWFDFQSFSFKILKLWLMIQILRFVCSQMMQHATRKLQLIEAFLWERGAITLWLFQNFKLIWINFIFFFLHLNCILQHIKLNWFCWNTWLLLWNWYFFFFLLRFWPISTVTLLTYIYMKLCMRHFPMYKTDKTKEIACTVEKQKQKKATQLPWYIS